MTNIVASPLKLTRGRRMTVPVRFLDSNRVGLDVTNWEFFCDFRYRSTDTTEAFTLSSETSPPTITKDDQTQAATKGIIYLTFTQAQLADIVIPALSGVDFPFVQLVGELCYINDSSYEPKPGFMLRAQVYEKLTRSIDGSP